MQVKIPESRRKALLNANIIELNLVKAAGFCPEVEDLPLMQ